MDTMGDGTVRTHSSSEISIKEFLDYLKTAYQIRDSVENVLIANGKTDAIDWLKTKELGGQDGGVRNIMADNMSNLIPDEDNDDAIKAKLQEVLSEGLLDSVLTYLTPSDVKRVALTRSASATNIQAVVRRKPQEGAEVNDDVITSDSEVLIHVCDESKSLKRDFACDQRLLVEKMGYFAQVAAGQRLDDMDISVHCDVAIFDWLMRWVKGVERPQVDAADVIPILVSAAFLQMEPLLEECLQYLHGHLDDVLRMPTNFSCLNDAIVGRLAAMYTNAELEGVRDKKDRIQSRLFCKLIESLAEIDVESVRGHWSTLAYVYKCAICEQLIEPTLASRIPCVASRRHLRHDGSIVSSHRRDSTWRLDSHILRHYDVHKQWRRTYWKLWADAHFMWCATCTRFFPANRYGWCRHHPDPPQFFTLDAQRAPLPIGRYPCCGERAYRYQILPDNGGCQFREHTVDGGGVREAAILSLIERFGQLILDEPPQLLFPERLTRLVARDPNTNDKLISKETFWWDGFEIIPPRPRLGLLDSFIDISQSSDDENDDVTSTSSDDGEDTPTSGQSSTSDGSAESNPPLPKKRPVSKRRKKTKKPSRHWQHNLSARSNQDVQRTREEDAIRRMVALLNRRTANGGDTIARFGNKPPIRNGNVAGGVWVRLESEWRECNAIGPTPKTRNIFTGRARTTTKPTK